MHIDDEDKAKYPKFRTLEGYFEDRGDSFAIFEKDPHPVGTLKYAEIKSISIKPAGTLYNGEVTFELVGGGAIKYPINSYQNEDFKELKERLKK